MDTPAECADLPAAAAEAWAAFRDAEVELARERARAALASRACQVVVVPRETLLDLYRLDGLLALATGNDDGLVAAAIRAVVAGPDEPPPARYGPDLGAAFATWAGRLGSTRATVTVQGGGTVYADGLPITSSTPRALVQGEHLFQVVDPDGTLIAVRLADLTSDVTLPTPGVGAPAPVAAPVPAPVTAPAPAPVGPAPAPFTPPQRRHPAWAFVLAGGGAALGAGGAAYAVWLNEDCARGFADPVECAAIRPYVNTWLGAAVGGGALALAGTVLGAAGLPAKD
jgi:hypothetical protein